MAEQNRNAAPVNIAKSPEQYKLKNNLPSWLKRGSYFLGQTTEHLGREHNTTKRIPRTTRSTESSEENYLLGTRHPVNSDSRSHTVCKCRKLDLKDENSAKLMQELITKLNNHWNFFSPALDITPQITRIHIQLC